MLNFRLLVIALCEIDRLDLAVSYVLIDFVVFVIFPVIAERLIVI